MSDQANDNRNNEASFDEDRRKFLAACGKFAVVTPPALTILLSTSLHSEAIASSGGNGGSGGNSHGGFFPWKWLEMLLDKWF